MEQNSDWRIERYTSAQQGVWDDFVRASCNATFLFERGYMDYHADRFHDHSLMAYKGHRLLACLPANIVVEEDGTKILQSHGGLTYGGWATALSHFDGVDMLHLFDAWMDYCRAEGISVVDYKPVPYIYAKTPAQEDIYALFRHGAVQTECNLSESVILSQPLRLNTLRRRTLRKAEKLSPPFVVREIAADDEEGMRGFYALLCQCLGERYEARPVHTYDELMLLRSRFPNRIRVHVAEREGTVQAGVCIYDCDQVAHCQYIATTPDGRRDNLLTPLFVSLMEDTYADRRYFDFGTSNEEHGRYLNDGLLRQKASFGAGGVAYTRWILKP